jgi:hypothetical protein
MNTIYHIQYTLVAALFLIYCNMLQSQSPINIKFKHTQNVTYTPNMIVKVASEEPEHFLASLLTSPKKISYIILLGLLSYKIGTFVYKAGKLTFITTMKPIKMLYDIYELL